MRPGGQMRLSWEEHGDFLAVVERVEPPTVFSYRFGRLPGEPPRQGTSTVAEFTLEAEGDRTRVRVVETGFNELKIMHAERNAYIDIEHQGWREGLAELSKQV